MRVVNILALGTFAAALTFRCLDPVLPPIAVETGVDINTAAALTTGFALPYALIQPTLGAAGDLFGKTRIIVGCLVLLVLSCLLGAIAPSFETLFAARVLMGMAAGGVFPLALALTGDLVPVAERQTAAARLLATTVTGMLMGSAVGGIVGDLMHWRAVLVILAVVIAAASVTTILVLRSITLPVRPTSSMSGLVAGYRTIFRNRQTWIVYSAVFLEGLCLHGFFPFVAPLLARIGETRSTIAGLLLAGFAAGGLIYSLSVRRVLSLMSVNVLMLTGGLAMPAMLVLAGVEISWAVQFVIYLLMGLGFYAFHGSLQIFASELAPAARGSAVALFATFLFLGQAIGPITYGFGFDILGVLPSLALNALVLAAIVIVAAIRLRHDEAAPREQASV